MFDELLDQIAQVRARVASKPDFRWGVVTGTAPLTVRLDADEDPLDGSPSTLVTGLGVGDRVMVMIQHHRATVTGVAKGGVPVGVWLPYGGSVAPAGWLLCQGQSLLRADFPGLFGVIGTSFGAVDGDHFSLPDMRERVAVGMKTGSAEFGALGATYGAKTHTLTVAEMPSHTHKLGHATTTGSQTGLQASGVGLSGTTLNYHDSGSAGSGQAHNNIQPSLTANYIIRY